LNPGFVSLQCCVSALFERINCGTTHHQPDKKALSVSIQDLIFPDVSDTDNSDREDGAWKATFTIK
jgi:hypothetical protein